MDHLNDFKSSVLFHDYGITNRFRTFEYNRLQCLKKKTKNNKPLLLPVDYSTRVTIGLQRHLHSIFIKENLFLISAK